MIYYIMNFYNQHMTNELINHLRNRSYMSGVERDKSRVKSTGEVFTPTPLVQEILNQLPIEQFTDHTKTFLDPSCGDGQFLSEVILKKMENGSTYQQALSTTYGVDLMEDNCWECIRRLYQVDTQQIDKMDQDEASRKCPDYRWSPGLKAIFKIDSPNYTGIAKIVCADGLEYDYNFGETVVETFGQGLFELA